jgi:hypothetical protein
MRGGSNNSEGGYTLSISLSVQCPNPLNIGVFIMLTISQLNTKIAGIRRSTAALRANIQEVLCSAAGHAYEHGDVTTFTKLFEATSGVNRKRIAAWVRDNGFATLQKDGTFKLNKTARNEADFESGDDVAMYLFTEVPHWYVEEEKAGQIVKELDALQRIKSLRSQIAKQDTVVKHVDFQSLKAEMEGLMQDMQKYA